MMADMFYYVELVTQRCESTGSEWQLLDSVWFQYIFLNVKQRSGHDLDWVKDRECEREWRGGHKREKKGADEGET